MKISSRREGELDLGRVLRGLLRRRGGTILLAGLGAVALWGVGMIIYGSGSPAHHHDVASGRDLLWVAARVGGAGVIGNWVAVHKRRIQVEDELDDVKGSLYRVEELLGEQRKRPLHLVKD